MIIGRPKSEIIERSVRIRADFARRYDLDELREQLCHVQLDLCFLCGRRMQSRDSVIVAIEHVIPVYLWAEADWSLEDACRCANDGKNLRAVHTECNSSKNSMDVEDWFESQHAEGLNITEKSAEKIECLRKQLFKNSQAGGRVQGRRNVESGHWSRVAPKGGLVGGRIGGPISGKICKEKGIGIFAPGVAAKGGRIGGRRRFELYGSPATPESRSKRGRDQGRKNVENGHLDRIRTKEVCSKGGRIGGHISGRKNVESGHLARIRTKEHQIAAGRVAGRKSIEVGYVFRMPHVRWHVKRGIVNPNCTFCLESQKKSV